MRSLLFYSLRGRLGLLLVVSTIIPIVLIGIISYNYIYVSQVDRLEQELAGRVASEQEAIESLMSQMSNASQMLVVQGGIGRDVMTYLQEDDEYERAILFWEINRALANVYLSNPNIGAVYYYFPNTESPIMFANMEIKDADRMFEQPELFKANLLTYYGPHESVGIAGESVFSLIRTLEDDSGNPFYAFLEIKSSSVLQDMFDRETMGLKIYHTLLNVKGDALYSDIEGDNGIYQTFSSLSATGWQLIVMAIKSDYEREIVRWYYQFLAVSLCSLLFSLLLGMMIWRVVDRSLLQMNRAITKFTMNLSDQSGPEIRLIEFQAVFRNFEQMRDRIVQLVSEIKYEEKRRGELEVEKVLVQINPHFIHNTLNTIQWLARMKGQQEIVKLVTVFTRILHYNLGKKNIIVTLSDEIAAIEDYIELQNIRYDSAFNVRIDKEQGIEAFPMPRFILQPLVENALYHGLENSEGFIEVKASSLKDGVQLIVSDTGKGISAEKLEGMRQGRTLDDSPHGLGIGLRYVYMLLDTYYRGKARIDIESHEGKGTTIIILLPNLIEEESS